jgi:hypothetical protein
MLGAACRVLFEIAGIADAPMDDGLKTDPRVSEERAPLALRATAWVIARCATLPGGRV